MHSEYESVRDIRTTPNVATSCLTTKSPRVNDEKKVAKEKYMFSDGKNEIKVEIDNEDFPTTPVNEKTRVQIRGEVDREILRNPEIDVKHVLIVK